MTDKATDFLKLLEKASLLYLADKFAVPVRNRRERDSAVEALSATELCVPLDSGRLPQHHAMER